MFGDKPNGGRNETLDGDIIEELRFVSMDNR